jgi:hypothetical protein
MRVYFRVPLLASPEEELMAEEKVRENRMRRMAERQGLELRKSRRRDPRALDYGTYALVNPRENVVVAGVGGTGRYEFTLDDVEAFLTGDGNA